MSGRTEMERWGTRKMDHSAAIVALLIAASIAGCATVPTGYVRTTPAGELTRSAYENAKADMGVVLVGVNWGRAWGYCGFENVQLRRLAFDRMPIEKEGDEAPADLVLEGPTLMAKPVSVDYAFLLEPGEYALTEFHIKAAKSVNDVGAFHAGRTRLIEGGRPVAGSFNVGANELVYIGHFAPDCPRSGEPIVWRYYLKDAAAFKEYLTEVKNKYPFLDMETAQFRLFHTTTIGHEYHLQ
jgi:hypothetical protein